MPATGDSRKPPTLPPAALVRAGQRRRICIACGYDLRGLNRAERACPECGAAIDDRSLHRAAVLQDHADAFLWVAFLIHPLFTAPILMLPAIVARDSRVMVYGITAASWVIATVIFQRWFRRDELPFPLGRAMAAACIPAAIYSGLVFTFFAAM